MCGACARLDYEIELGLFIGHPHEIRLGRNDIAIKVREDRQIVIAVSRAGEAPARPDAQPVGLHDSRNALVVDEVASALQLSSHASITVAGQFVLITDQLDESRIAEARAR